MLSIYPICLFLFSFFLKEVYLMLLEFWKLGGGCRGGSRCARVGRGGGGGLKVARSSAVIQRTDSGAAREGICVTLSPCSLIKNKKNRVIMLIGFPVHSPGSADNISPRAREKRTHARKHARTEFHWRGQPEQCAI